MEIGIRLGRFMAFLWHGDHKYWRMFMESGMGCVSWEFSGIWEFKNYPRIYTYFWSELLQQKDIFEEIINVMHLFARY